MTKRPTLSLLILLALVTALPFKTSASYATRLYYGMSAHEAGELLGLPDETKNLVSDQIVLGFHGKYCLQDKTCAIVIRHGLVISYFAIKPKFRQSEKSKPKIKVGMTLSKLVELFGQPVTIHHELYTYGGIICKTGTCGVIVHEGRVTDYLGFDASYTITGKESSSSGSTVRFRRTEPDVIDRNPDTLGSSNKEICMVGCEFGPSMNCQIPSF